MSVSNFSPGSGREITKSAVKSLIINTSFDLKDKPIFCSPQNALDDFLKSKIDIRVLEILFWISKRS
jgi:predicted NodU family carbamoyl transferase